MVLPDKMTTDIQLYLMRKQIISTSKAVIIAALLISPIVHSCTSATASAEQQKCCKICRKGKACGDTCINKSHTCHVIVGMQCNQLLTECIAFIPLYFYLAKKPCDLKLYLTLN